MDKFVIRKRQKPEAEIEVSNNLSQPQPSTSATVDKPDELIKHTDDSDSDDNSDNKAAEKKKRKIYTQKFRDVWLKEFPWLKLLERGDKICVICNKSIQGGKSHLERHEKNLRHTILSKKVESSRNVAEMLKKMTISTSFSRLIKSAEYKLTMGVIVEHNSPMLLMDHLPKLLASSLPDSQIAKNINCARTKTTQIIHMLKNYAESSVVEKLRNQFFSIIIDETTDISSKKCLAILVRFLDASKDKIKDTLLALVEVENCTAGGLTQAIVDLLEKFEINKNNVIGFAADNASVMMGQFGGVQAKLKELVNPDIFVLGCICHSLHLCASEACKKIPSEAEEFVQDIYNYICRSPKRLKVYEEFQAFIDLKPHKLLTLSQTRWLSLEAVVKRILEKWQALKLYFTSEVIEEKDFMRPRQILDKFERPETEIYLSFLCYILPLINKLNLEFQSEKAKIHILFERIMTLAKSIIDINPLNVYEYLKNEEIYLGQQAESVLTKYNLRKDDVRDILNNCLKFYVELCLQIRNRFKNLSQYENFQLLNPNTVLERPTTDQKVLVTSANLFLTSYVCRTVALAQNEYFRNLTSSKPNKETVAP
nr:unnamed protein product [Callosobruchus analis]